MHLLNGSRHFALRRVNSLLLAAHDQVLVECLALDVYLLQEAIYSHHDPGKLVVKLTVLLASIADSHGAVHGRKVVIAHDHGTVRHQIGRHHFLQVLPPSVKRFGQLIDGHGIGEHVFVERELFLIRRKGRGGEDRR
ncbi:hypothetical protein D3C86_1548440 [compost metagenome]